jgi:DEAD/DEAH box helicase domain-containing protein
MDKIVFDIETKNTFADVGGSRNFRDLLISFVGVYSYNQDKYLSFFEHELDQIHPLFQRAGLVIGFSSNAFDIPVLQKHFDFDLKKLNRLDLLEEIERGFGRRVSLDNMAKANLGTGKLHTSGLESIRLYREGKMEELKEYCLQDVKLTKDLYDLARQQRYLLVPDRRTGENMKVEMEWPDEVLPSTLF